MNIYLQLLFLALIVVYIVDLSGFTDSWRSLLARMIGVHRDRLRPLPPFDCGECMTFWVCCTFAACHGQFYTWMLAYCAGLAFMSIVLGQLLDTIREILIFAINKIRNIL